MVVNTIVMGNLNGLLCDCLFICPLQLPIHLFVQVRFGIEDGVAQTRELLPIPNLGILDQPFLNQLIIDLLCFVTRHACVHMVDVVVLDPVGEIFQKGRDLQDAGPLQFGVELRNAVVFLEKFPVPYVYLVLQVEEHQPDHPREVLRKQVRKGQFGRAYPKQEEHPHGVFKDQPVLARQNVRKKINL